MDDHVDIWGISFVRFAKLNQTLQLRNNFGAEQISHEYGSKCVTDGYPIRVTS